MRIELTSASIAEWRHSRAKDAATIRETLDKLRSDVATPVEVKEAIDRLDFSVRRTTVPRITLIATPKSGAVMVPEIQALNRRLSDFREELRQEISGIELAVEALTCAFEFDQLPTELKSPTSADTWTLAALTATDLGPRIAQADLKAATLSELFKSKQPRPASSYVVPKP